jgi:peptide/nickel transport system substrate-binding protein
VKEDTMQTINRRSLLLGAAAAPLLPASPATAQAPKVLRVALSATNVNSLDPRKSVQNADQFGSRQIYDALVDPAEGTFDLGFDQLHKVLVDDISISPDSRVWSLALKRGVFFHRDFGEMTADDVVFTYRQMLDPGWASTQRAFLTNLEAVEAVDPYRVRFQLRQPDPTFHASGLISLIGSIVSRKAVEAAPETYARAPVGTGAFAFNRIDPSRGIVLSAFDRYHGGRPKIDEVEIRYMADPTARTLGFIKGDLHIIEGARLPGWLAQVKQQKPDAILDSTRPGSVNTMFFNLGRKPFDDVRVRKALRYAIDRNVIINAFDGAAGPSWGINPPDFPGALQRNDLPEELRYDFDPDRAKALLRDAGLSRGLRFNMLMTQREDYASLMLMIQEMWRRVGVEVSINTVDHTTYHAQKARDVNPIVMNSETFAPVSTQIPRNCYSAGATVKTDGTGGGNYSHYGVAGPGIDDILAQALAEPGLERRQELVRQAELKVLEDMPAFTLCTLAFVYLRNPRVNLGFDVRAGYARYRLATATMS